MYKCTSGYDIDLNMQSAAFLNMGAMVTLLFVAFATTKRSIRFLGTFVHTALLCTSIARAIVYRMSNDFNDDELHQGFFYGILICSCLQLVFGLLVIPSPRIVAVRIVAEEDWDNEPPSRVGEWGLNFRNNPTGNFLPITDYPWGWSERRHGC